MRYGTRAVKLRSLVRRKDQSTSFILNRHTDGKSDTEGIQRAEDLARAGEYEEALSLYAQLAERETDRRQRSVIRAKEREARAALEQQRIKGLSGRLQGFIDQRKFKEARRLLDDTQHQVSSQDARELLNESHARINKLIARRRRNRVLLVLIAVLVVAGAAYATQDTWLSYVIPDESLNSDSSAPSSQPEEVSE